MEADRERAHGWIFRELGVTPVINCAGVRTQFGGTNPAPEVLAAMNAASDAFVDLDELAEGAGRRIADLTGAEWGIVTSSTTAALSLATAACIAGNDPELMLRLPRTDGIPHRVVMPAAQRFDYDHAVLATGAEIECAKDRAHLESLLDDSAVMLLLLARRDDDSHFALKDVSQIARERRVPVLVDAAGLSPGKPDRWLRAGADLVVYAGGKYLRGPQSSALLIGREKLCKAAWMNGAPHQAFGRGMKIGKEEIVGAVVALDRWLNSPSAREEREHWLARLEILSSGLSGVPGVTTTRIPSTPFVTAPRLRVQWDSAVLPLESSDLRARLLSGSPRILIHDFWSSEHSIVLDPVNLTDHEAQQVSSAVRDALIEPHLPTRAKTALSDRNISGAWLARLQFLHRQAEHELHLEQRGAEITGRHVAKFSTGPVTGAMRGDKVSLVARHQTNSLPFYYTFEGIAKAGQLKGKVLLGAASDEHLGPVFQRQFGEGAWACTPLNR